MRCLFLVVFVYAVRCDDGNYYVIQVPRSEPQRALKVYWNVPTMQCISKRIPFDNLYEKYGIHQNDGDEFRGEEMTIMYDPGLFPALLKNETSGKFKFRNGGVPQEGDLEKHLEAFKKDLDLTIPDKGFSGIGVIDFESWRPVFRQNFGVLTPYKDVSYEIERKLHWWWPKSSVEAEAKRRFESSARVYMEKTIELARQLRPGGIWGYYGFPYCFNMASNNKVERCADKVPEENDGISWLWRSSTALYPSVYSSASLSTSQLTALIRGRVREARRVKRGVVLPYFWYRYRDGGFLTQTDLNAALYEFYKSNASGFIIWGSSNDVNTLEKCRNLYNYIENIFGPAVAKYTKKPLNDKFIGYIDENNNSTIDSNRIDWNNRTVDGIDTNNSDKVNNIDLNNSTTEDSDIFTETHAVNKRNSTDDIKKTIEEEIKNKFSNYVPINEDNTSEQEEAVLKNNNVLIDLIINSILNKEFNSLNNNNTTEYSIFYATTESSLTTQNIDSNDSITSTTDYNIVSTTDIINITNYGEIEDVDYDNESHKHTQIDTNSNNFNNDVIFGRNSNFNIDENYNTRLNLDILSTTSSTTESTTEPKSTTDLNFVEDDEFFNSNTFTIDEISTTEHITEKNHKEYLLTRNIELNSNSEFGIIKTENEFDEFLKDDKKEEINTTDEINTTKSNYDINDSDILNTSSTSTYDTFSNTEVSTQSQPKSDEVESLEISTATNFDKTTSIASVKKNEILGSYNEYNKEIKSDYAVFDQTTTDATDIIKDGNKMINNEVNKEITTDYTDFDETTVTSIATSKISKEDSTAISATENKVSGSSRIKKTQYIYCIIFYVYSIKNCMCSVFGQCS